MPKYDNNTAKHPNAPKPVSYISGAHPCKTCSYYYATKEELQTHQRITGHSGSYGSTGVMKKNKLPFADIYDF